MIATQGKGKRRRLMLAGALIGAAVFFLVYGVRPLNVCDDSWIWTGYVDRDIVQHYAGWVAYRASETAFPLCMADSLCWPGGISVLFTDSIPLLCILFKALSPLLPATFQFFGVYVLACLMLQGAFAAGLLSLFLDGAPANLIGSLLFVCSPILLERAFRHTALASHFLILAALYLYFLNKKSEYRCRWSWLALSAATALIHPYFLPMVFAILFADLVERMIAAKAFWKPAGFLLLNGAVVAAALGCAGFFETAAAESGFYGYGLFAMNANSLFNPASLGVQWSAVLPPMEALYLNENFLYLGLGMLLFTAATGVALLVGWKRFRPLGYLRAHPALFFCCVCLSAFAVSNIVNVNTGRYELFKIPQALQPLFNTFRSSSRMFWPVYYLVFLFVIVFAVRHLGGLFKSRRAGIFALCVLAAIQLADMAPTLAAKHADFAAGSPHYDNPVDCAFFADNADAFDTVITVGQEGIVRGLYLGLYGAKNGINISDPMAARWDQAAFEATSQGALDELLAGAVDPGALYVFSDEAQFFAAREALGDKAVCAKINDAYLVIFAAESDVLYSASQPDLRLDFA